MSKLRILITGHRDWSDDATVYEALRYYTDFLSPAEITVVHGGATGADSLAARAARRLGMTVEEYPADWGAYGTRAGPKRNKEMVALGADVCLAFPLVGSRGTLGCMREAAAAGIPVVNLGDSIEEFSATTVGAIGPAALS